MTLGAPGSVFLAEIREQPQALRKLLEHGNEYEEVANEAVAREPHIVRLVGHGSSDNAASYGVYAFGIQSAWTALRDSISLSVYYGAELDLQRSVVVGLSQSGRTPDVVAYVARARERGAFADVLPRLYSGAYVISRTQRNWATVSVVASSAGRQLG